MNDHIIGLGASGAPALQEDRTGWLKLIGVLQIIYGGMTAFFSGIMLYYSFYYYRYLGIILPFSKAALLYGFLACFILGLLCLVFGIGALKVQRWVQKLASVFLFNFAAFSVLAMVYIIEAFVGVFKGAKESSYPILMGLLVVLIVGLSAHFVINVFVPIIVGIFYRTPSVVATFEKNDQTPYSTDHWTLANFILTSWLFLSVPVYAVWQLAGSLNVDSLTTLSMLTADAETDLTDANAPNFEATEVNGKPYKLAEHIGKEIIVLNFFATWCGPCKAEMPELNRFFEMHRQEPIAVIAVDEGEDKTAVMQYLAKQPLSFPVLMDTSGDIGKLYEVAAYPTTVVIGADGKIKLYHRGMISNAENTFAPALDDLHVLASGGGVTQSVYLENLAKGGKSEKLPKLEGRGLHIAQLMDCPCTSNCHKKVDNCDCGLARKIKRQIRKENLDHAAKEPQETDAQILERLTKWSQRS